MSYEATVARRGDAVAEFDRHGNRNDGARVVNRLADGLGLLRDTFFNRVHGDVERAFGMDSMLLPVSAARSEVTTNTEIDIYLVAEASLAVRDFQYVPGDAGWFPDWLGRLRLGEDNANPAIQRRLSAYLAGSANDRWRAFSTRLVQVLPEAGQAPLVIFRLLPLAIAAAAAIAFGDHARAEELRKQQVTLLPSIADCHACRGRLLENGEKCPQCGNPLWKYDWLTAG